MKFHTPSFLIGIAIAAGAVVTRERLRPIAIEVGALALQLSRLAYGLVARQREEVEDLVAAIDERVRERLRTSKGSSAGRPFVNGEAHP